MGIIAIFLRIALTIENKTGNVDNNFKIYRTRIVIIIMNYDYTVCVRTIQGNRQSQDRCTTGNDGAIAKLNLLIMFNTRINLTKLSLTVNIESSSWTYCHLTSVAVVRMVVIIKHCGRRKIEQ